MDLEQELVLMTGMEPSFRAFVVCGAFIFLGACGQVEEEPVVSDTGGADTNDLGQEDAPDDIAAADAVDGEQVCLEEDLPSSLTIVGETERSSWTGHFPPNRGGEYWRPLAMVIEEYDATHIVLSASEPEPLQLTVTLPSVPWPPGDYDLPAAGTPVMVDAERFDPEGRAEVRFLVRIEGVDGRLIFEGGAWYPGYFRQTNLPVSDNEGSDECRLSVDQLIPGFGLPPACDLTRRSYPWRLDADDGAIELGVGQSVAFQMAGQNIMGLNLFNYRYTVVDLANCPYDSSYDVPGTAYMFLPLAP